MNPRHGGTLLFSYISTRYNILRILIQESVAGGEKERIQNLLTFSHIFYCIPKTSNLLSTLICRIFIKCRQDSWFDLKSV